VRGDTNGKDGVASHPASVLVSHKPAPPAGAEGADRMVLLRMVPLYVNPASKPGQPR
jgi:hypothetical protein